MKQVKRRIWAGAVCYQVVYNVPDRTRNIRDSVPRKPRFENEEERKEFLLGISRRKHARSFNANFGPSSLYSTLTCDQEHEIHDFEDAKRVRKNFIKSLKRAYPEAVVFCYIGRGKSTHRIHFHMVSEGIPKEVIEEKWKHGGVRRQSKRVRAGVCRLGGFRFQRLGVRAGVCRGPGGRNVFLLCL